MGKEARQNVLAVLPDALGHNQRPFRVERAENLIPLPEPRASERDVSFAPRAPTYGGRFHVRQVTASAEGRPPAGPMRAAAPTVRVGALPHSPAAPPADDPNTPPPEKRYSATFLAFLPLQIYAHKLRGFIDELDAEVVSCSDERALLRFTKRNWFGKRIVKDAVFLQIDLHVTAAQ